MENEIQKFDFNGQDSLGFEIVNISHLFDKSTEEMIVPHRTNFYQIIWFQDQCSNFMVDFNSIDLKSNSILFINKNSIKQFPSQKGLKAISILFTDSFFCETQLDHQFLRSTSLFNHISSIPQIEIENNNIVFSTLFQQMEQEFSNNKDCYKGAILRNQLKNLVLQGEREIKDHDFIALKKDADFDLAILFKDLLETNYSTQKKVSFYCEQMHITSKKLNKATNKIFGNTPKEYINERVVLEAKRLLVYTSNSIKEIGFSLGFEEPTNFIKYFRNLTSKTPIEFRKELT